jgi:DNA-binding NtrC family response regulator
MAAARGVRRMPSARAAAAFVAAELAGRDAVNVLLASADTAWRGLLFEELRHHHVFAEVVGEYADATRRLSERTYDVVVVDLPAGTIPGGYADLQKLLIDTRALVIAVGTTRFDDASEEWFEVFVRKVTAPSRIASIVESLATASVQVS